MICGEFVTQLWLQHSEAFIHFDDTIFFSSASVGNKRTVCSISLFDVAPWSEITPCIKIDKPQVVYRLLGYVMKSRFHVMHMAKP